MGKTEKKRKENHATKVTKIPKSNRRKCGMNKTKFKIPFKIKLPLQRRRRRLTSSRVRKKNHFAIYGQEKISFFKRELLPLASRASNVYFFVRPHMINIVVIAKHE